jgi:hypothetical protein
VLQQVRNKKKDVGNKFLFIFYRQVLSSHVNIYNKRLHQFLVNKFHLIFWGVKIKKKVKNRFHTLITKFELISNTKVHFFVRIKFSLREKKNNFLCFQNISAVNLMMVRYNNRTRLKC